MTEKIRKEKPENTRNYALFINDTQCRVISSKSGCECPGGLESRV